MAITHRYAAVLPVFVVLAELVHAILAAAQHRMPLAHDGFQYFTLQYYFLNNAIQSGEVAQWIPYMNQGTIASLWQGIQASLLQSVLLQTPGLVRHADLLGVYHAGMFVDAMVLLVGTWLCARRFFSTATTFFVVIGVVGGSVWMDQPYWNFKLYYAFPLLLELGHRFLETGRWRWFFLMTNLLAVQMMGGLPYIVPVTSFAVAAYFTSYAVVNHQIVLTQVRSLRFHWGAAISILASALSLAAVYASFTTGTNQLVNYNPYRNPDGTATLEVFLSYGGSRDLRKWIDMVLNLSPWMDFTLYSGMLVLPLALISPLVVDRRRLHFLVAGVTLLLFTLGTPVSAALFHLWPGMKFFRHIGLVSPLVRLFFCFAAGAAFEEVIARASGRPTVRWRVSLILLSLILAAAGGLAFRLSTDPAATRALVDALSNSGIDRPMHVHMPDVLSHRLWISAIAAWTFAFLIALGTVETPSGVRQAWVAAVLLLVFYDVYQFKIGYLLARSERIGVESRALTKPAALLHSARRARDLKEIALHEHNPRVNDALTASSMLRLHLQGHSSTGAQYWTNDAFLFADEAGSSFQVDSWLKPLDELLRTYWKMPIDDTSGFPPGTDLRMLEFPSDHPAAARIAGVTADKIRFFSRAFSVDRLDALPPLMTDPGYGGDLLFVLDQDAGGKSSHALAPWSSQVPLSQDDAAELTYRVETFSSNLLRLRVSNSAGAGWMSYSDVWHPFWRAAVNGRDVPIYRANMAYKAVPLVPGENIVEMRFASPLLAALTKVLAVNSAFWLATTAWMLGRLLAQA